MITIAKEKQIHFRIDDGAKQMIDSFCNATKLSLTDAFMIPITNFIASFPDDLKVNDIDFKEYARIENNRLWRGIGKEFRKEHMSCDLFMSRVWSNLVLYKKKGVKREKFLVLLNDFKLEASMYADKSNLKEIEYLIELCNKDVTLRLLFNEIKNYYGFDTAIEYKKGKKK